MILRSNLVRLAALGLISAAASTAQAGSGDQWANSVIDFSSQWSNNTWAATQALGEPNTFNYGDLSTAWAPSAANGSIEFLSLGFATPTFSTGALIRETYGNGFVVQIDAIDTSGALHTVWTGTDPSQPGQPANFNATWAETAFRTVGLKIHVNTDHNLSAWEEIDAVQLQGIAAVPEPAQGMLMLAGLGVLGGVAVRRASRA